MHIWSFRMWRIFASSAYVYRCDRYLVLTNLHTDVMDLWSLVHVYRCDGSLILQYVYFILQHVYTDVMDLFA